MNTLLLQLRLRTLYGFSSLTAGERDGLIICLFNFITHAASEQAPASNERENEHNKSKPITVHQCRENRHDCTSTVVQEI